ncbi:MAG TPA: putative Ig domain-containing protein [Steroidobacteraceae bacterium]|nr:putative Ig domain-containing protein [Steroidobacteraceae bacterium]
MFKSGGGIDLIIDDDNDGLVVFDDVQLTGADAKPTMHGNLLVEEINGKTFYYAMAYGNLRIARSEEALSAPEGVDRISIGGFKPGDLGISFPLAMASSSATLNENSSVQLTVALPMAGSGDYVRVATSNLPANLQLVTGDDTLVFTNGYVDVPLAPGQTTVMLSLLSVGDVDGSSQLFNLTATVVSALGEASAPATLAMTFNAANETAAANPQTTNTIHLTGPSAGYVYDTTANDEIVGAAGNDGINLTNEDGFGGVAGGDDSISGVGGDDVLYGGAGADRVQGGNGNDYIRGQQGGDLLEGGEGRDMIYGQALLNSGVDAPLDASGDDDRIYGESQVDLDVAIAQGNTQADIAQFGDLLAGNAGNDIVVAGATRDLLSGGAGDDVIVAGAGDDFILGDAQYFENASVWQNVGGANGAPPWVAAVDISWTFSASVVAGATAYSPKTLQYSVPGMHRSDDPAQSGRDLIHAGNGNDVIFGGGGDDLAYGEAGDDTFFDRLGNDTLLGGDGNDVIIGGDKTEDFTGEDFLDGGTGNDWLQGSHAADTLFGGAGNDVLLGDDDTEQDGEDYLNGEDGDDVLIGGGRNDTLIGGSGNDELYGESAVTPDSVIGDDLLDGGDGADLLVGGGGADTLLGGEGADQLFGDSAETVAARQLGDFLDGGAGNDLLVGTGGGDSLFGREGDDQLYGDGDAASNAIGDGDLLDGGAGNDTLVGGGGSDTLLGGAGNDQMDGDASDSVSSVQGDDTLDGGDGNDVLTGGGGADVLSGGAGNDHLDGDGAYVLEAAQGDDTLDGGDGDDQLQGGGGNDSLSGGAGIDLLVGGAGDDVLDGGDGVDQLQGGSGNDTLISDGGAEALFGGAGDDTYVINSADGQFSISDTEGSNTVIVNGGAIASSLNVTFSNGSAILQYAEGASVAMSVATFAAIGNLEVGGLSFSARDLEQSFTPGFLIDDTLALKPGVSVNEISYVGQGQNLVLVYSGALADWVDTATLASRGVYFRAGAGEQFGLAPGTQALSIVNWYNSNPDAYLNMLVDAASNHAVIHDAAANAPRTFYGTDADESLGGTDGGDDLRGNGGADVLYGNAGNDSLSGGTGDDWLLGGDDADTYVYNAGDGYDAIVDTGGVDRIQLGVGIAPANVAVIGNGSSVLVQTDSSAPGDLIEIVGANQDSTAGVESIAFADGTIWNAQEIQSRLTGDRKPVVAVPVDDFSAAAGVPFTLVVPSGTFTDVNGDALSYSAATADGEALPEWLDFDAATRTFSGTAPAGAAGVVSINLYATDPSGLYTVDSFEFRHGALSLVGTPSDDVLTGTAVNEYIQGLAGNDTLSGAGGDDTLVGGIGNDALTGGAGNDTYIFNRGDGHDQISISGAIADESDTLQFGPDLHRQSDIEFGWNGAGDVTIRVRSAAGTFDQDSITLTGYLTEDAVGRRIDSFEFNGETLTPEDIEWYTMRSTGAADYLRGSEGYDDLRGLQGDDTLVGLGGDDSLSGGEGNDTYKYGVGHGADTLTETGGADDVLRFGAGITAANLTVTESTDGLAVVAGSPANGDSLLLTNWAGGSATSVDRFVFADGSSLNRQQISQLNTGNHSPEIGPAISRQDARAGQLFTFTLPATALVNLDAGDTLTLVATRSNGDPLPSWLTFNPATRTFSGTPANSDETLFDVKVRATDSVGLSATLGLQFGVHVRLDGTNNGDYLAVSSPAGADVFGLNGDDTIYGSMGNDELNGGAGNDTISGGGGVDLIIGGTGNDSIDMYDTFNALSTITVRTNIGDGTDNIAFSGANGDDVIEFGAGISASYVRANQRLNEQGKWVLPYNSANIQDRLELYDQWYSSQHDVRTVTTQFRFADGQQFTAAQLFGEMVHLSSGDDSFVSPDSALYDGGSGNDVLIAGNWDSHANLSGGAGNDALNGFVSNGATLNGDAGDDRLFDGSSADVLNGGDGDDYISSTGGSDVISGGAGNDVINVNTSASDLATVRISDTAGFDRFEGSGLGTWVVTRNGDDLRLTETLSNPNTIVFENWFAGPQNQIEEFVLSGTRYSAAQIEGLATGINTAPSLANTVPDAGVRPNSTYFESLYNYFIDTQGALTFSATLASGAALPAWLTYDTQFGQLSGIPVAADAGMYTIRATATDSGGLMAVDEFTLIVNSSETNGNSSSNTFNGTSGADIYFGKEGDDTISGANGNDQLYGNLGADVINGGAGDDTIVGGPGNDTLIGGANANTYLLDKGDGADIHAMEAAGTHQFRFGTNITLSALQPSVVRNADGSIDVRLRYNSQNPNDQLLIRGLYSVVSGTLTQNANMAGYSFTYPDGTTRTLAQMLDLVGTTGTEGDDILILGSAGTLTGAGGNDLLIGSSGADQLNGGAGNDTLDPGSAGTDTLAGGTGDDTYLVSRSGITITELANEGVDTVKASLTFALNDTALVNVENVTLTGSSAINATGNSLANVLIGNTGNNTLDGGIGNDTLVGLEGNDTLTGGVGNDTLNGGLGDDTYNVDSTSDVVNEVLGEGTDTIVTTVQLSGNLAANVENLTLSGSIANGTGNELANSLVGNAANNTLTGNDGNDTLNGGSGTDTLVGGLGDDVYVVDTTTDTITEVANQGTDTVQSTVTFTLNTTPLANVENLTLSGGSVISATGNALANVLTGNSANNTLTGNDGADTLNGMGGTDTLVGGLGNDLYVVDTTTDVITETANQGTDTVQSSVTFTLNTTPLANTENLTLTGGGIINATGNALANVLAGNSGNNALDGGAGDDTLNGMGGTDSLVGGLGADTYQYTSGGGADTINNVAADSLIDRLQFTDLASTQVAFSRTGNNLVMTRVGVTGDTVTVTNWFSATANRLDFVNFTNVEKTAAQIDTLVAGGGGTFLTAGGGLQSFMSSPDIFDAVDRVNAFMPGVSRAPWRATLAESLIAAEQIQVAAKVSGKQPGVRWQPIKDYGSTDSIDIAVDRLASAMASFGAEYSVISDGSLGREAIECGVVAADPVAEIHMLRNPALGRLLGHAAESHF